MKGQRFVEVQLVGHGHTAGQFCVIPLFQFALMENNEYRQFSPNFVAHAFLLLWLWCLEDS